jgi:hypothetical protein
MNIDIAINKLEAFRKRAVVMLAVYQRNEQPSKDLMFTEDELKSLDSMLNDLALELTGKTDIPTDTWLPPVKYAYRHGYGKSSHSWLESFIRGVDDSVTFFTSFRGPQKVATDSGITQISLHMSKDTQNDSKEVQVAQISAKQAIIVASITALAGIIGAFISYSQGIRHSEAIQSPAEPHHFLKIDSVEDLDAGGEVRIVMDVNGQPYSYPSRAVWDKILSDQPGESFPLEASQTEYVLHFSAFYRNGSNEVTELDNSEPLRIPTSSLPFLGSYNLYGKTRDIAYRGGTPPLVVRFELR